MADDPVSFLEQEMRSLVYDMAYPSAFPWSTWHTSPAEKKEESAKLLEKVNRVRPLVEMQSNSDAIWAAVFGSALILGRAMHGIRHERLRNAGQDANPKSELNKYIELFPLETEAEEERRVRVWRNSKLKEVEQRKEARKLISAAQSLAEAIERAWDVPLVQLHLSDAGGSALRTQLQAFAGAMHTSLREQPFQESNNVTLKRMSLVAMGSHFRELTGKPCLSVIADFAKLVSPSDDPEDRINAASIKKEIQQHARLGSLRARNSSLKTP